jgi:hypothetical protein
MLTTNKKRSRSNSSPSEANRLAFTPFQFPTLVDVAPAGEGWIRDQAGRLSHPAVLDYGNARAYSRHGFDWTEKYSGLIEAAEKLGAKSANSRGEAVVQNALGLSDFHVLRRAMTREPHRVASLHSTSCISTVGTSASCRWSSAESD